MIASLIDWISIEVSSVDSISYNEHVWVTRDHMIVNPKAMVTKQLVVILVLAKYNEKKEFNIKNKKTNKWFIEIS